MRQASLDATYSIGSIFQIAQDCADNDTQHDDTQHDETQRPRLSVRLSFHIMKPLIKAEQDQRRCIEEQGRAEVLRLWRSSMVCAIQVAATKSQALECSEKMGRAQLLAAEMQEWGVLQVSGETGASELNQREVLVHSALCTLSNMFTDALLTFHNTGRNSIVRGERHHRNYLTEVVFLVGLHLTHVTRREAQRRDELWHERLLSLHVVSTRMAASARNIHEKNALAAWMQQFESHFRAQLSEYEAGYRCALRLLAEHTNQLSVVYVEEPWARRIQERLQQAARLRVASLATWAVGTSIPFCQQESECRLKILEVEAEEDVALRLSIHYQQMKLRYQYRAVAARHENHSRDVATRESFAALEAGRRERIRRQYDSMIMFLQASIHSQ
jgi:hypothetical protein